MGVEKATSTTTKLRVVCDASAKTMSGVLLNDCLLAGPSLPKVISRATQIPSLGYCLLCILAKTFQELSLAPSE